MTKRIRKGLQALILSVILTVTGSTILGTGGCATSRSHQYNNFIKQYNYDSLAPMEKVMLKGFHQKYGPGPIPAEKMLKNSPYKWIRESPRITGRSDLTDADLIFILRSSLK